MIKIICEAGLNWRTFDEAVEYVERCKVIGADIVKYQYVDNPDLPQMNKGEWKALKGYCDKIGIEFMATPSTYDIAVSLFHIGMKGIKIGSDRINETLLRTSFEYYLMSDGYSSNEHINMYCVSLYPCSPKFIDFNKMSNKKYLGFSDHTLRYDKEWCDKIKACKNIQYYEKHITLFENCIDKEVSLDLKQFKELVKNIRNE